MAFSSALLYLQVLLRLSDHHAIYMGSPKAIARPPLIKEPYARSRENPYFKGLLRDDTTKKSSNLDFVGRNIITRSTSDIRDIRQPRKPILKKSETVVDPPLQDSDSDVVFESLRQSSSKPAKQASFSFLPVQIDLGFSSDDLNDSTDSSHGFDEESGDFQTKDGGAVGSVFKKSFSVRRKGEDTMERIPLPQSAASFFSGYTPIMEIVESCESINMLNSYLKERRDDVNTGAPGKFMHAVLAEDVSDAGSFASTIMYAFYLNETFSSNQMCTVPIINMNRADLNAHAELKWILSSCQIDETSLVFIDEIDLFYYDLFGSLKLVLLNSHKLPNKIEALKESVVEIFNCKKSDSVYPWVKNVTIGQDMSCCTLLAEKFAMTSPEVLSGQGFSRLLLSGILLDTSNLTHPNCSSKDKYMATLLINGAGRFGCDGLYQILRYKTYDISDLKVGDVLRKELKKWSRVGMSSIGITISQLLGREDTSSTQEIKVFQQMEKLRVLVIVSGYYDTEKNFKREMMISAESIEVLKNVLRFFDSSSSQLPMKVLPVDGLREEMRAFEIDKFTSRKIVERLLEELSTTFRG